MRASVKGRMKVRKMQNTRTPYSQRSSAPDFISCCESNRESRYPLRSTRKRLSKQEIRRFSGTGLTLIQGNMVFCFFILYHIED